MNGLKPIVIDFKILFFYILIFNGLKPIAINLIK